MDRKTTGRLGEEFAANYLESIGYVVLEQNYHSRYGEIDIIAQKDEILSFVEVKTRAVNYMVSPLEAITLSKRIKIIKTAELYLQNLDEDCQPRFDVFEIITSSNVNFNVVTYNHFEGAFDCYGNV